MDKIEEIKKSLNHIDLANFSIAIKKLIKSKEYSSIESSLFETLKKLEGDI